MPDCIEHKQTMQALEETNLRFKKELAEQETAEQELQSANEQLLVLLDSLPVAVYRCQAEGDYAVLYMSQNVVSFTGYTAGNFIDQPDLWLSRIHPDDTPRISGEMALLIEKGRHVYEYRWRHADGTYLWIRDSLRLIRPEDGNPSYLVGMWQNITEDSLAAEAMRKANDDLSLFRKLLDKSSDAIEVVDPETLRFLDVNETACRELGYSREEFLSMRVHDIYPDMDKDTLSIVIRQLEESGSARFETTHRRKDGSIFPVEANIGTITLEKTYRLNIVRDITERKLTTQALEEAELRFRTIFNATLDGILVVDAQSQAVIMGNKAICDMLGYELEELMRLSVAELSPVAARPEVQRQFARQAKGEIFVAPELLVQRKDGSVFYADVSGGPPMLLGGKSVMVGVVHDVTERKRAEETLRYKNTVLSILQWISPSAILLVDENARIVSYNEKFIQMWGLPMELVRAGTDEPVLRKVCEQIENPDEFLARVQYLYKHKEEISHDELLLRDGRSIDRHSSPIIGDDGRYYGRAWDFRDITKLRRATEEIGKLNDELELKVRSRTQQLMEAQEELVRKEKLALLGQVAGSVGHELRNPLGVMNNAVYFLQTVLVDADETTREYLEIIKTEIADADRIVADLLDSVRTRPPQPAEVSIGGLIDRTLRSCTMPAVITTALDLPESLPPVWVDAGQIQQVLRNLISNGMEALVEGGTLAIKAVENRQEGTVSISVRDTGCGMPPEVLAKLFQPLFTTKARGIGLGLVVVKSLTEANGGTIEMESAVGRGTTFSVTLPAKSTEGNQHA